MKKRRSNARALSFMAAAIALEGGSLFYAKQLLTPPEPQVFLASLVLVALPGIVLTVFIPALRDLSRGVGTTAFLFITVGVALGLIVLSNMFFSGAELAGTIGVGLVAILITAVIAYIDWTPTNETVPVEATPKMPKASEAA